MGERLDPTGLVYWSRKLVFILVPVNGCKSLQCSPVSRRGYFIMQQNVSPPSSSPFFRPKQSKANRAAPLRALSVCLLSHLCLHTGQATQSRRRLDLHCSLQWPPIQCNPFASHPVWLPAGGANNIRRPGFPPQSIHPIKPLFTPNQIPTLQGYGPG
jgi:hypothetical protein